jgi:hypothetical protein
MRVFTAALALIIALISPTNLLAQSPQSTLSLSTSVPRLINITGVFRPADGSQPAPVETVMLAVYAEETGDTPLWQETQNTAVDSAGRYTLLLGASEADGIPLDVFVSGEARWLGITWSRAGEVEGARTRLTSVPYALKASDAETLGGRPAAAYLLAPTPGQEGTTRIGTASLDSITPTVVNPGTPNFLAKYVNGIDLGSSSVYESAGRVGVNTSTPRDIIHSQFANTDGGLTGLAVQNLGNTATSYSGMLFYDQFGALGQFQGFNNVTHEYRINNIARNAASQFDGSINFMIGGTPRLKIDTAVGTTISGPVGILAGNATIGLLVSSSGSTGISVGNTNPTGTGVFADTPSGYGVFGSTATGTAIWGLAETTGYGVFGATDTGAAIAGIASNVAVGWAGYFDGDVNVTGILFKGAGAFRIDHPLDPENKYLSHSFVESPDMKNIYDGVAVFDGAGEAIVTLPDWFEALNEDFRYQLTPMGAAFVPYVAKEIAGNQFKVGGGIPGKKVSWQVTGIRHDAFANANRIQVEELKPNAAVGTYLHPEAFGQPVEKGRSTATAQDSKATAKDRDAGRADEMKARLRAISQKPAKQ